MTRKNTYILFTLSILTLLSGVSGMFEGFGRVNPFLFYEYYNGHGDKGIHLELYLYELSCVVNMCVVLILFKYVVNTKSVKNIISPFIWIAVLDILDYICFYKQLSYVKLPLLILLVLIYNIKWKKSEVK